MMDKVIELVREYPYLFYGISALGYLAMSLAIGFFIRQIERKNKENE